MRLTQEVDYAFRIVAHLAQHEGRVIGAMTIAKAEKIPERFTLRILRKLNQAGITDSKRGAFGGYYLKKPKEKVDLYEIIVAVDGPIEVNKCLHRESGFCSKNSLDTMGHCKFHIRLATIQTNLINSFKESKITEFIE